MKDGASYVSCLEKAMHNYARYESKQRFVDKIESDTLKSCGGKIEIARVRLDQDRDYKSHCGARDAFMHAAQTHALMALLFKE